MSKWEAVMAVWNAAATGAVTVAAVLFDPVYAIASAAFGFFTAFWLQEALR